VLVLLDLDGTLTDPYDGITRSVTYALDGLGLPRLEERQLRSFIGPPLQDQFAALGLDEGDVGRAVELYRERFRDHGLYENRVYGRSTSRKPTTSWPSSDRFAKGEVIFVWSRELAQTVWDKSRDRGGFDYDPAKPLDPQAQEFARQIAARVEADAFTGLSGGR
jgi:hypothetical protein